MNCPAAILLPYSRVAIQSRRDLQKVNALLGHVRSMARKPAGAFGDRFPPSIVELGVHRQSVPAPFHERRSPEALAACGPANRILSGV